MIVKKLLSIAVILCTAYAIANSGIVVTNAGNTTKIAAQDTAKPDAILADAFNHHAKDLQVYGQGTVIALLADDNTGSRHQRFIITLPSGQTLLVVHNIDIAPRIDSP